MQKFNLITTKSEKSDPYCIFDIINEYEELIEIHSSNSGNVFKKENILELFESYLYEDNSIAFEVIKKGNLIYYSPIKNEDEYDIIREIINNKNINTELRANATRIYATYYLKRNEPEFKSNIINIASDKYPIIRMGLLYGLIEAKENDLIYAFYCDPDIRIRKEVINYFENEVTA